MRIRTFSVTAALLISLFVSNIFALTKDEFLLDIQHYMEEIKTRYGQTSNEYLKAILALEDLCISSNASLYPYIAHTVVENEITIKNTFGVDSPEYCSTITILDMLLYGQYLDDCDFNSYKDKVHKVILNLESEINKLDKNRTDFLRILSAVYVEDIANPEKALVFCQQLFDIVKDTDEPLLSEDYEHGVSLMIGAYELSQNESSYLKWIKNYFENLKIHSGRDAGQGDKLSRLSSVLLVFLSEISPDKFPLVRDYLFTLLKEGGVGPMYLQNELRNWAFNEYYSSLNSYENLVLRYLDKSEHVFYYRLVAEGLSNLEEGAFQKALPYYEKSWSLTHPSLRLITAWHYIMSLDESSTNEAADYWSNLMVNYFFDNLSQFGNEVDEELNANILVLHELSKLLCDKGRYSEAIAIEQNILKTYGTYLKKKPEELSTVYCNLGDYYSYIFDYSAGIESLNKALELLPKDSETDRFTILHNIAHCHSGLNNSEEAIQSELEALTLLKKSSNYDSTTYYTCLAYLGGYYADAKKNNEAEQCFEEAIQKAEENPNNTNSLYYATLLSKVGGFYFDINTPRSIELNTKANQIFKAIYGDSHPFVIESVCQLAMQYYLSGDRESAISLVREVNQSLFNYLNTSFYYLTNNEKKKFWEVQRLWFKVLLPQIVIDSDSPDIYSIGYNFCLFTKGMLLNCEQSFQRFIANTNSSKVKAYYNELRTRQKEMDEILKLPLSERSTSVSELGKEINKLNREMLLESKRIGGFTQNFNITSADVKHHLGVGECAIEFTAYPTREGNVIYGAYVLKHNIDRPNFVKLFSDRELKIHLNEEINDIYTNKKLSELIWGILYSYMDGIQNIYFSTDGLLQHVSIEYLLHPDGNGLMCERYNMYRLSSTRELVINREEINSGQAVIFGGIRYDADIATMEQESNKYRDKKSRGWKDNDSSMEFDIQQLRSSLEYLPETLTEVMSIDEVIREKKINSSLYIGTEATEESFKSLSGTKPWLLHFSTHGFYWNEEKAERKASLNSALSFLTPFNSNLYRSTEEVALERTGLFMAGCKNIFSGKKLPENIDDGILTAFEISNLDLSGVDLVVLSACQTGMGDISEDGVLGLQRGFKKAGANTILMSLWDVNDEATQILMTEFYKNYINGKTKRESLLAAQKKVRENLRFKDPEYWAAFILLDGLN